MTDYLTLSRELREKRNAATSGEWSVERRYSNDCEIVPRMTCPRSSDRECGWIADMIGAPYLGYKSTLHNADFIAFAANNITSVLDAADAEIAKRDAEIESLRAEVSRLKEGVKQ